jgi:hypothetical protein
MRIILLVCYYGEKVPVFAVSTGQQYDNWIGHFSVQCFLDCEEEKVNANKKVRDNAIL